MYITNFKISQQSAKNQNNSNKNMPVTTTPDSSKALPASDMLLKTYFIANSSIHFGNGTPNSAYIMNFTPEQYRNYILRRLKKPLRYDWNKSAQDAEDKKRLEERAGYNKLPFQKLDKAHKEYPPSYLPSNDDALTTLVTKKALTIEIRDEGGLKPVNSEKPVIYPKDVDTLGKPVNSHMKIAYGEKIGWGSGKIARDIMQNFYDGNGHTLEGTKIEFKKVKDGYIVRVSGAGVYDYKHLLSIGDTTKDNDKANAGFYGEGTKIVAVNLLANYGVPYVEYGCGDWNMRFTASKDKSDMLHTLNKNKKPVEGSYIEFKTNKAHLVHSMIESKNFFYHPQNPDFHNLDYENEYFGFKYDRFPPKCYLIQKYDTEHPLCQISLIFKKMPEHFPSNMETGRDRNIITADAIEMLGEKFAQTMSDEDLIKAICTLDKIWAGEYHKIEFYEDKASDGAFVRGLISNARDRRLKIDFSDKNYIALPGSGFNGDEHEFFVNLGMQFTMNDMARLGVETPQEYYRRSGKFTAVEPTKDEVKKLKLLEEAIRIFAYNSNYNNSAAIYQGDTEKPRYIFEPTTSSDAAASAILERGGYQGHWVSRDCLAHEEFSQALATWMHEISHQAGDDTSARFSDALLRAQSNLFNIFSSDPNAREQLKILCEIYDDLKLDTGSNFDKEAYKSSLLAYLGQPLDYDWHFDNKTKNKVPQKACTERLGKKVIVAPEIEPKKIDRRNVDVESNDINSLMSKLAKDGSLLCINIENEGGMKPVGKGIPSIHEYDKGQLGKETNAFIKIKYGQKVDWSAKKIARDIMQNFYDGNGNTLEGTKIEIAKDGKKYKIRISGEGKYDYKHLESIGSTTKDSNSANAGFYGEGSKIVAVNLLANGYGVPFVEYACGDWKLKFSSSSDDIATADMVQTLTKNEKPVEGNYIEFSTEDPTIVSAILMARNYFYHPQNPDFKNLDFENDFFGFKFEGKNGTGHLYLVQRYDVLGSPYGDMPNMSLIFKKMPNDPKLKAKVGYNITLNTGRDRQSLSNDDICRLVRRYSETMTDKQLVKAICQLEPIWSANEPDGLHPNYLGYKIVGSLMSEVFRRGIEIDFKDKKYAAMPEKHAFMPSEKVEFLQKNGYKFVPYYFQSNKIKMAEIICEEQFNNASLEPTEIEKQKLKLLDEAVRTLYCDLRVNKDGTSHPLAHDVPKYICLACDDNKNVAPIKDGTNAYAGHWVTRKHLNKAGFLQALHSWVEAMMYSLSDTQSSSAYSYLLTDIIALDIENIIKRPALMEKLSVIREVYESLDQKEIEQIQAQKS